MPDEDRYAIILLALRLCHLIARTPMTRAELSEALGLHERSIRRVMDALVTGGVEIRKARRGARNGPMEYTLRPYPASAPPGPLYRVRTRPRKQAGKPRK